MLPFVSTVPSKLQHPCPSRLERCQRPFSFHHVLSLTGDAQAFEREVGRQNISGNLDSPEGGFDAILQAALCQVRKWGEGMTLRSCLGRALPVMDAWCVIRGYIDIISLLSGSLDSLLILRKRHFLIHKRASTNSQLVWGRGSESMEQGIRDRGMDKLM